MFTEDKNRKLIEREKWKRISEVADRVKAMFGARLHHPSEHYTLCYAARDPASEKAPCLIFCLYKRSPQFDALTFVDAEMTQETYQSIRCFVMFFQNRLWSLKPPAIESISSVNIFKDIPAHTLSFMKGFPAKGLKTP